MADFGRDTKPVSDHKPISDYRRPAPNMGADCSGFTQF